jgi:dTDP-4-amino-4,6-dideoxygalactose transaminase
MFDSVSLFENTISSFFGSPYSVAVDCCTHAVELCLRYLNVKSVLVPKHTYLSIPMTCKKLNISWNWKDDNWEEYYKLDGSNIYDAATLWRQGSYLPDTFMCISFQYKKHLSLGRGGAILCSNKVDYDALVKLSYDGRERGTPWTSQNISSIGYHYYMTPETAILGLEKFNSAANTIPKKWSFKDYPNLAESCPYLYG